MTLNNQNQRKDSRNSKVLSLVTALALSTVSVPTYSQEAVPSPLQVEQGDANSSVGPRAVPGRLIPVPNTVSEDAKAMIASPYGPFWNINPGSPEEWRVITKASEEAVAPMLVTEREEFGVEMEAQNYGGVGTFVLTPKDPTKARPEQVLINFHGGGYVFGGGESGTAEAMMMAAFTGYNVIAVDYRMPPDAPFPAAVDDALAVYQAVIEETDPANVGIFGTSAGGGLTLALVHRIRMAGLPMPGAIAALTPWSDLTQTGDSYKSNEWLDNILVSYDGYLGRAALLYADGHDMLDPLLSPVYGSFDGFPPTFLMAGTRDLFLSNTVRVQQALKEANVETELEVYEGLSHAQYLFNSKMPETRDIYEGVGRFFDTHLAE
jgi:acetyl esterase/lipase